MTITDNGRVDEELVAKGRELAAGGRMPSKRELQRHLGKGWDTVNAVLQKLAEEKAAKRREALRRLTPRKRSEVLPIRRANRFRTVNEPVAVEPWWLTGEEAATAEPLTVEEHPEPAAEPVNEPAPATVRRRPASWPIVLIAMPAFAAVWSGWVGLGGLTGFGVVQPFPGIPGLEGIRLDTAITLPIGVETYGAYALYVWLSGRAATRRARRFAMWSAFVSLALGAAGQVTYHLLVSDGPWVITTAVSCLPVLVLGMAAALRHLVHAEEA
jgi:hypothetical protein